MPILDYPFVDIFGLPKPALPVVLENPANGFDHFTWALIDTGADYTVIPEFIAKNLYHNIRDKSVQTDICLGISGPATAYYHTFRLNVLGADQKGNISEKTVIRISKRLFAVVPHLHTMVLGERDFLKKYVLIINYPKKIFSIRTKNL
jgi:hypothetical protein